MVAQNLQWKSSLLKKKDYILTSIQKTINNNDVLIIIWSMYTLQKKKSHTSKYQSQEINSFHSPKEP